MKQKKPVIVGLILIYNQAPYLEAMWSSLPKHFFSKIIAVDDGSIDDSVTAAKKLGIQVFSHAHTGYGGNVKFGLSQCKKMNPDYIVDIHGDGQYDVSIVPNAIELMQKNQLDFLVGTRLKGSAKTQSTMPLYRKIANKYSARLNRMVFGVPLSDVNCGFRIYSKKMLQTPGFISLTNGLDFTIETILWAHSKGLKIGEIPVHCRYDIPHSEISIGHALWFGIKNILHLFRYM